MFAFAQGAFMTTRHSHPWSFQVLGRAQKDSPASYGER